MPVCSRVAVDDLAERLAEMKLIGITHGITDFLNRHSGSGQQLFCLVDAYLCQHFDWSRTGVLFEDLCQVGC